MLDPSVYRIPAGTRLDLEAHDPNAKTGFEGGRKAALPEPEEDLADIVIR